MDINEVRRLLAEAFADGGLWGEQWRVWNDEKPSRDFGAALKGRGATYAVDVLETINTK
jgi:hypothetical protein